MPEEIDAKEFFKVISPIIGWCRNCKNPLYESVTIELRTVIIKKEHDVSINFFIAESKGGGNSFVNLYQFSSVAKLQESKTLIKEILKAKTVESYNLIMGKIHGL